MVDDDWWEDDIDDDDDSSSSDSINEKVGRAFSDDDEDDDDDSRVAAYVMRLQPQYSSATTTKTNPTSSSWDNNENGGIEISDSGTSIVDNENNTLLVGATKNAKRFCNRGLQTWHLARQKWLTTACDTVVPLKTKKPSSMCPVIPESFRKELKQCLIDRRQFELSQSIPLSCVVDAYQEVWQENGCD